ncbi:MAG: hypothetical protein DRG83_10100 [Deltaproteobacteria bacterium]|nr:MAG: hypothetical protein DRG83_10100 [Deltaproteobacteria bacterium]
MKHIEGRCLRVSAVYNRKKEKSWNEPQTYADRRPSEMRSLISQGRQRFCPGDIARAKEPSFRDKEFIC